MILFQIMNLFSVKCIQSIGVDIFNNIIYFCKPVLVYYLTASQSYFNFMCIQSCHRKTRTTYSNSI